MCDSKIQTKQPLRILHIAPFNTAGVPFTLVQAERSIGYLSRLITLHKHKFDYKEDICLDLPIISFPGSSSLKKLLKSNNSNDNRPNNLPKIREYSFLEKPLFKLRDRIWHPRINAFLRKFDINDFDLYQLDGGVGFYHDSRIIKQLYKRNKTIVTNYLGSDLRIRGVIYDINKISSCNFTVEYDHLDLYRGINHIPFPFNFSEFKYQGDPGKTPVIIGHAPSNRANKGSKVIIESLRSLQESYSFEVQIIENQPHQKALELKSRCSLFIDQISNIGYGINTVESMAMKIPTFSSLTKEFKKRCPDSPIVEISAENIREQLIPYIKSPELRIKQGEKSKKWSMINHDSIAVVKKIHRVIFHHAPTLDKKMQ